MNLFCTSVCTFSLGKYMYLRYVTGSQALVLYPWRSLYTGCTLEYKILQVPIFFSDSAGITNHFQNTTGPRIEPCGTPLVKIWIKIWSHPKESVGDDVVIRQAIQQWERVVDGHCDFRPGCSELRSKLGLSESLRSGHAAWKVKNSETFPDLGSSNIHVHMVQPECNWIWRFYMACSQISNLCWDNVLKSTYLGRRWREVSPLRFTVPIIAIYSLLCIMTNGNLFGDLWPLCLSPSESQRCWRYMGKFIWNAQFEILWEAF